jgi:NADH:ubiquinone oxidoreductase subunit F (NADH-binding)/(2Fe-2S) ferredoxin
VVAEPFETLQRESQTHQQELESGIRVRVGAAICGRAAGADAVQEALTAAIAEQGLQAAVHPVGCIGLCYAEPLVDVQRPGGPRVFYRNVTPEMVPAILDASVVGDGARADLALGTLGEGTVAGLPRIEDSPQWKHQVRVALRNCGVTDPGDIRQYVAAGGYEALARAVGSMTPQDVMDQVAASGLRGRGGAAFPTSIKWSFLVRAPGPDKYILANCEEGDPGAYNDKGILESDPHTLVEGTILAGYATGANRGYVFIRHGHHGPIDRTREAIRQAYDAGLLGQGILGSDFTFDIEVALVGESYVSGEETALMEAIEGKRAMPRARPPFPAAVGVFGKPSNINNIKTLAYVPEILRRGGEWFAGIGYERSKGTAILCLNGNIRFPGLYEVPFGLTLGQAVEEIGGGAPEGRSVKLLQTGGPLGGVLGTGSLGTVLDFESMAAAGAILGSGGIIVGDDRVCAVDLARNLVAFCQFESCGKCFPCRLGMTHLIDVLERIASGQGQPQDLALMPSMGEAMAQGSMCGHGQLGFNPISSALRFFGEDFRVHIEEGRCPTGGCLAPFHRPTRTRPVATGAWYPRADPTPRQHAPS